MKAMLCDGDCGNIYDEKHLTFTVYGDNFCRECMFNFVYEQEHGKHEEHQQQNGIRGQEDSNLQSFLQE